MPNATLQRLTERLELADQLHFGRDTMFDPQDLPGRYGRVIEAIDRLLAAMDCESVVAGGWAVWRHGYEGRMTQDVDIALPADRIDEFLRVASVRGFEILPKQPRRWPKMRHNETQVKVDILPEGAQPGTANDLAPTRIAHPATMGAIAGRLVYICLESLIELKLAAGRDQDIADVVELVRRNEAQIPAIRQHLQETHDEYVVEFDEIVVRAKKLFDR